jgi:exodeoxyribonuclease VII large subunit
MASLPLFDRRGDHEPDADGFWTVSALTGQIKAALEDEFGSIGLVGEISNLSRPRSGHLYFNLKDEGASIRAVMWRSAASKVVFDLADGLSVRVRGSVTVYEPRGDYQIQVRTIEPEGIGALDLAFRQLCERLSREGLFDAERKRPIPRFPRRIVLVTSPTGAAVRDFLQVAGRRWPGVEILIAPAKVQGLGAAEEIAEAIAMGNRVRDADLIVLVRGGGSLEDLWAFNEEVVARAIFASRLPVVSGVGHEVDVTVADLVADVRALTPSEAAERCVPDARELLGVVDVLGGRLARSLQRRAERDRARLERVEERLHRAGRDALEAVESRLDLLSERMNGALRSILDDRAESLARRAAQLEALSPLNVLARGYSLTRTEDGRVVRAASDVEPGQRIVTRLASGEVVSRVEALRDEP